MYTSRIAWTTTPRIGTVGCNLGHEAQCHLSEINLKQSLSSLTESMDCRKWWETVPAAVVSNSVHVHPSKKWVRLAFWFPEALPQIQNQNPSSNLQKKRKTNIPSKAGFPWFSNTAKSSDIIFHSRRTNTTSSHYKRFSMQSSDWVVGEMHVGLKSKDSTPNGLLNMFDVLLWDFAIVEVTAV